MKLDLLFRQLTPLVLLGLLLVTWLEPWIPGIGWIRANLGEQFVLRFVLGLLVLYVLLLWAESLRLHGLVTGTLKAVQQYGQAAGGPAKSEPKDPRVRLEAARLLIAALQSPDQKARTSSHHNLVRLVGQDLGKDPAAWQAWLQQQERAS
jgi:hypothetical protein